MLVTISNVTLKVKSRSAENLHTACGYTVQLHELELKPFSSSIKSKVSNSMLMLIYSVFSILF